MIESRRRFLLGATALLAAPAIVRVANLMPMSVAIQTYDRGPAADALLGAREISRLQREFSEQFTAEFIAGFERRSPLIREAAPINSLRD